MLEYCKTLTLMQCIQTTRDVFLVICVMLFIFSEQAFNVINGGSHAGNKLAMQEFMLLPTGMSYTLTDTSPTLPTHPPTYLSHCHTPTLKCAGFK